MAARQSTRDYRDTVEGWEEAGLPIWGSIPERVGIAAGPTGPLFPAGLDAYGPVLDALTEVPA